MNTKQLYFSILLAVTLCACSNLEQGTGQVLDNARSVINSESPKIWIPKDEGVKQGGAPRDEVNDVEEQKKRSEEQSNRY